MGVVEGTGQSTQLNVTTQGAGAAKGVACVRVRKVRGVLKRTSGTGAGRTGAGFRHAARWGVWAQQTGCRVECGKR